MERSIGRPILDRHYGGGTGHTLGKEGCEIMYQRNKDEAPSESWHDGIRTVREEKRHDEAESSGDNISPAGSWQ